MSARSFTRINSKTSILNVVVCAHRLLRSAYRSSLLVNQASRRFLHKAIPAKPINVPTELPELKKIDQDTILQLERVALVNLGNEEGARRLAAAIQLADTIAKVDTKGVQPLYTVLEDRYVKPLEQNGAKE
jgi:hypothetical protein